MHHKSIKTIGYVTDVIEMSCWKNQLSSMTSKRSHHLIKLLMLIGVSIQMHLVIRYFLKLKCENKQVYVFFGYIRNFYREIGLLA